jgi:hypothetical protein
MVTDDFLFSEMVLHINLLAFFIVKKAVLMITIIRTTKNPKPHSSPPKSISPINNGIRIT